VGLRSWLLTTGNATKWMKTETIVFSLAIGLSLATSARAGGSWCERGGGVFQSAAIHVQRLCLSRIHAADPSGPQRLPRGEVQIPSLQRYAKRLGQIISSNAAAPMQVDIITVDGRVGSSGATETDIVVEAKPTFFLRAAFIL
jgi:hypothetical protein